MRPRLARWQGPVFLVNRRLGLVSAAPSRSRSKSVHATGAPLLPKLRGQFAEFLDGGSLVHLGLLDQPTCVGLRYGCCTSSLEAFLGDPASTTTVWRHRRPLHSLLGHRVRGFACGRSLPAWRPRGPSPSSPRPPIAQTAGSRTGILTRCPSPTACALGLGPPHPQLISMAAEPSGIR